MRFNMLESMPYLLLLIVAIVISLFVFAFPLNGGGDVCFVDDDKLRAELRDSLQRDIAAGGVINEFKQKEMERSFLQAARQLAAAQKCLVVNKDGRIVALPPTARDFTKWFSHAIDWGGGERNGQ